MSESTSQGTNLKWRGERRQFSEPYHSTVSFTDVLVGRSFFCPDTEVLDIGAGLGANLPYLRERNPETKFLGLDYNVEKVEMGRQMLKGVDGIDLTEGDWFNLDPAWNGRFDGILNIHTLCCFRSVEPAINALCNLEPRWIAFNSLFWEADIDVLIHIRDYSLPHIDDHNPDGDFNIFSLPRVREAFAARGYGVEAVPFFPPNRIPQRPGGRGSYTMKTELHDRSQFSGPVHLPWHFLLAKRSE